MNWGWSPRYLQLRCFLSSRSWLDVFSPLPMNANDFQTAQSIATAFNEVGSYPCEQYRGIWRLGFQLLSTFGPGTMRVDWAGSLMHSVARNPRARLHVAAYLAHLLRSGTERHTEIGQTIMAELFGEDVKVVLRRALGVQMIHFGLKREGQKIHSRADVVGIAGQIGLKEMAEQHEPLRPPLLTQMVDVRKFRRRLPNR